MKTMLRRYGTNAISHLIFQKFATRLEEEELEVPDLASVPTPLTASPSPTPIEVYPDAIL